MSLTKIDLEKIEKTIKSTIKSEISDEWIVDKIVKAVVSNKKINDALDEKQYKALSNFFKFVWIRRNIWKNEI